jgi:hypothetical protein
MRHAGLFKKRCTLKSIQCEIIGRTLLFQNRRKERRRNRRRSNAASVSVRRVYEPFCVVGSWETLGRVRFEVSAIGNVSPLIAACRLPLAQLTWRKRNVYIHSLYAICQDYIQSSSRKNVSIYYRSLRRRNT